MQDGHSETTPRLERPLIGVAAVESCETCRFRRGPTFPFCGCEDSDFYQGPVVLDGWCEAYQKNEDQPDAE